jgi:hypothetical protein
MMISGRFDVELTPLECSLHGQGGNALGRMAIKKTYQGELSAAGAGEMLSARTGTQGSAGYVAIEDVSGSLAGKSGSFVLQHFGTMAGGRNSLRLEVVPGSGTGELAGLSGNMAIRIEAGQHYYDFDFQLAG